MASETGSTATLTVRLVRSFPHRNVKHVVYHNIPLSQTCEEFKNFIMKDLPTKSGIPPPFKKYAYDTFKIQHKAHGSKTANPVISTEDDDTLMLKMDKTLTESGVENETEISCFKLEDYLAYKENPETTW